jgi:hypothetical protein
VLQLFPYSLACRYRCVPVGTERGVLTLAICQRLEQELITQFQEMTQHEIFQVRCEGGMINDLLSYWQNMLFQFSLRGTADTQHMSHFGIVARESLQDLGEIIK